MNPFPHFYYLAPATAAQAASIYSRLHVTPRILQYDRLTSVLAIVADTYVLLLIWLVLATGLAARLRDRVEQRFPRAIFWQGAAFYFTFAVILAIGGLPLRIVRAWVIPHLYGLSNQAFWQWLWDWFKGLGINAGMDGFIAGMLLLCVRRWPRSWPFKFAATLTPMIAFGIFLAPIALDPIFDNFKPLPPGTSIASKLHLLEGKAGIGGAPIFVVDVSRKTNETNAYVTGFGPTLRIVIWDTLLQRMDEREIVAVIGHEMGHYVEGHLVIGFALTVVGLFIGFPLVRLMALRASAKWGGIWHLRPELHDSAALPLLLLCLQIVFLVAQPSSNAVSRWIEHRADSYSLGLVRDRVGLAGSFVDLSSQDLEDPNPPLWEKIWFDTHPPLGERIDYALNGQP